MTYDRPASLRILDRARQALRSERTPLIDRKRVAQWHIERAREQYEREVHACDLWAQIRATCTGEGFRQRTLADYGLAPNQLLLAEPATLIQACNDWMVHLADTADIPF